MNELDILEQLEQLSGKVQFAVLIENNTNDRLKDLFDAAFNYKRRFFMKQVPEINANHLTSTDLHDAFLAILQKLETRTVTGDAAKSLIYGFLLLCTPQQEKWYRRVIAQNLKIGIGLSQVVKAGFDIPEFDVMLAKDAKKLPKADEIIAKGVYVSYKLNGYRCIAKCSNGVVELLTREGHEYTTFPGVKTTLEKLSIGKSFVLDGEIMSDSFNAMQKIAFNESQTPCNDTIYNVFDYIETREWDSNKFKQIKSTRLKKLSKLLPKNLDNVVVVPQKLIHNKQEILELEKTFIIDGYEGAMAIPDIPYYRGRKSNALMKFKTFVSQDCEIIDFIEGKDKYTHMLGSFLVRQENGVECKVGTGINDFERESLWLNRDNLIGRIIEVKYQELSPIGKMLFPVFVRWRDTVSPGYKQ